MNPVLVAWERSPQFLRICPLSLLDEPLVFVTVDTGPLPGYKISFHQHSECRTMKAGSLLALREDSEAGFKEHQVAI